MTDPVPTPPGDQNLPGRQVPYVPTPFAWDVHEVNMGGDTRVFTFILDSQAQRTVTFWTEDELRVFADQAHALVTGGLTIADAKDLAGLRDAGPFEQSGG